MDSETRRKMTEEIEALGLHVNHHRTTALHAGAPFLAGILRAAEESLLVAHTMLKDADDKEL